MPFFSIIIPTYNRAAFIAKAIQSVLEQIFSDFELIVIDDASADNTKEIVNTFEDSRIVYVKNPENLERCKSRNKGIQISKGKYICFLDSDDYHLPNHLSLLHSEIQKQKEPQAIFFTNAWDESNGEKTERVCPPLEEYNLFHYIVTYTFNPQRMCVHSAVAKETLFDPEVYICEDLDFAARIALKYPVIQIKERTTVYVHHAESFTCGDSEKAIKEYDNYTRIFNKPELKAKIPKLSKRRILSMNHFHLAHYFRAKGKRAKMYKSILKSFFLFPKGYNGKTNKIILVMALKSFFRSKKHTVRVKLPLNIDLRYKKRFESKAVYSIKEENAALHKNVFVSHEGLCLKNLRLVPFSSFNISTKYDISFKWKYLQLVLEQYFVSKYGYSLKSQKLGGDETYFIIHTKWFNFSFWVSSSIHRLIQAYSYNPNMILIYPEGWDNIPYVQQTLSLFPNLRVKKIAKGEHCFVDKIYIPECREFTAGFNKKSLNLIRDFVLDKIQNDTKEYEKVYITRKNAKYRKIVNEDDILELLKKNNFHILDFDTISFFDQIKILQNTKCLVTLHGAALANTIFMPKQSSVLELMHEFSNPETYRFTYWIQTSQMDINYYIQFCEVISGHKNILMCDLKIDIELLNRNLRSMLA